MSAERLAKPNEQYRTTEELGDRWRCHPMTARRRMERLGVKPMKLTKRSVLYRMSDIVRVEAACV